MASSASVDAAGGQVLVGVKVGLDLVLKGGEGRRVGVKKVGVID